MNFNLVHFKWAPSFHDISGEIAVAQTDHFANDLVPQAITYTYDIMIEFKSLQAYAIPYRNIQYKKMLMWHFSFILVGIGKNNVISLKMSVSTQTTLD